jgi:hypothetical protein
LHALPSAERLPALRTLGAEWGIPEDWLSRRQFHIMTPEEIADAHRRGLDIQLHTHRHRNVNEHIDSLAAEIDDNRAALRRALGAEVALDHFCYPSGKYREDVDAVLAGSAIRSATLTEQGLNARGANHFALRRFVDGSSVSEPAFDAYLSGVLHFSDGLQRKVRSRAKAG